VGLVRTKLVALLLGPSGVGLVGLYQSAIGTVGAVAGLGIGSSGVRKVAEAAATGDQERIGRTIRVLRRVCWITGIAAAFFTAALAWPLSVWTFGSSGQAWSIAVLGLTLLLGSISAGQIALIQGIRRIGDLARIQIVSSVAGTAVSVGLYLWLGQKGIIPVFIFSGVATLITSWWFARRVPVPMAKLTWRQTMSEASGLVTLGVAFMLSALLVAIVALVTRSLILRDFGIDANGLYQAAWGVSGVFAGFILQAMGADFYPRLTAVAHDDVQVNQIVNEQTEIGILLALTGLVGTIVLSPWLIHILYSSRFVAAAQLLPWFVLGIFGRVVSWPLGFIQLAKGSARWFALTETITTGVHILMIWVGLRWFGLKGVGIAFAALYGVYTIGMLWVSRHICRFSWSKSVLRLLCYAGTSVAVAFALVEVLPGLSGRVMGVLVTVLSAVFCLRQICQRLGPQHRISRQIGRLPLLGRGLTV
jgi:antigen flippase